MGCANQAEVDLAISAPAQPLHLAIFKNAQQLGLQSHLQGSNLVQEERAPVGKFDLAGPRFRRPGERPSLAAEQFRFDQALRQGGAISLEADVGPSGPAA